MPWILSVVQYVVEQKSFNLLQLGINLGLLDQQTDTNTTSFLSQSGRIMCLIYLGPVTFTPLDSYAILMNDLSILCDKYKFSFRVSSWLIWFLVFPGCKLEDMSS